ncbi:MAG TPA: hypothetical protein VF624_03375 [Tepidisphaeraceae bacterium]|jgi:hypothetical protein
MIATSIKAAPAAALLVGLCLGGCSTKQQTTTAPRPRDTLPTAPISNTDACATRMQDMCGGLLLYYNVHRRLPASLDEMKSFPGGADVGDYACPVSRQPYVYVPNGIYLPEKNTRIVIYDAAPTHSNMRWAISIDEPQEDKPLVTKVIALPETFFLLRR